MQTGKRTRAWRFVAQEARRLAALDMAPKEIAAQLGVNWATVTRWMQAGKLPTTGQGRRGRPRTREVARTPRSEAPPDLPAVLEPAAWAAAVRAAFDLDATDDQLVGLAELALRTATDPRPDVRVRLAAVTRFAALAKQLHLVARQAPAVLVPTPAGPPPRPARPLRPLGADPRSGLMAVK